MKNIKLRTKKLKTTRFIIYLLCLLVVFPAIAFGKANFPEPTSNFYVNDYANVIDEEVEKLIVINGSALDDKTGAQVVIVTVDFTDGIPIHEYAADLFNEWKLGSAEKNNGLLILMSIGDEDYWAVQGKGLEDTLTSGEISQLLYEYLEPDFASENYSRGAARIYEAFIKRLGGSWISKSDIGNSNAGNNDNFNVDGSGGNYNKNVPGSLSIIFNPLVIISRIFRILFIFIILLIIISSQRRRYYRRYGIPPRPFGWFRRRRYGPGRFWGHFGPPPPWGGFWFGGRWHGGPKHRPGPGPGPRPGPGPGPFSSGGSPFGRSGGGGSTRGGGAGRSFFSGSSFGSSPFSGGKSFGGSSKPFGGGNSFGGRSGGGGTTRGGGAGRRK